jgi:hypothetical protein
MNGENNDTHVKTKSVKRRKKYDLPEDSDIKKKLKDAIVFKREDPSAYYEVVERVADGGFARVFHVRRLAD